MSKLKKIGFVIAYILWASIIPLGILRFYIFLKLPPPGVAQWQWIWFIEGWVIFAAEILCIIFLLQGEVRRKEKFFIVFISLNSFFRSGLGFLLVYIAHIMAVMSGVD